jgi:CBS domain-containing protein
MTKNVITITRETPIMEAAQILVDRHITGIPVVDAENNLVGILSEFDVLRLLLDVGAAEGHIVDEFMTKKVLSFEDNVTAIDVCEFFMTNPSKRRVPITHQGKLVGLVSRGDIVKIIVKLRAKKA